MSVNNICIHSKGGYSFYTLKLDGKKLVIGGVPDTHSESYISAAGAADALVLLTSKPEFTGGLSEVLKIKPDIEIYASAAGLRNIKEIVNREINEKLVKDNMDLCGMRFFITPNLQWVDSFCAVYDGVLFSGELFCGFDGSAVGLKTEFDKRLSMNKDFVLSALDRLEGEKISAVYPALGMTCPQGSVCQSALPAELFDIYRKWCGSDNAEKAVILYSSEYGFTKSLAERAAEILKEKTGVEIFDVNMTDTETVVNAVNSASMLAIGTNTINRNAPQEMWDVITRLDLVNQRGTPYFVFGSFGWAGDGIKLMDKTLEAMAMRRAAKPVEVLFRPTDEDFEKIGKAAEKLFAYYEEYSKS